MTQQHHIEERTDPHPRALLRTPSLLRPSTIQIDRDTQTAWIVQENPSPDRVVIAQVTDPSIQRWRHPQEWRSDRYRLPSVEELAAFGHQQPELRYFRHCDATLYTAHHFVAYRPGSHNPRTHPPRDCCQRCGQPRRDPIHQPAPSQRLYALTDQSAPR